VLTLQRRRNKPTLKGAQGGCLASFGRSPQYCSCLRPAELRFHSTRQALDTHQAHALSKRLLLCLCHPDQNTKLCLDSLGKDHDLLWLESRGEGRGRLQMPEPRLEPLPAVQVRWDRADERLPRSASAAACTYHTRGPHAAQRSEKRPGMPGE